MNAIASSSSASEQLKKPNGETSDFSASELHSDTHSLVRLLHSEAHMQAIDNLQNYCLGTRYGTRSRWRLCRRLAIDMVLKIFLSTISSRFGDVLTLTIYRQTFCEFKTPLFFFEEKGRFFDRKRRCMAGNGDAVDGVACLVLVRSFIAYVKL